MHQSACSICTQANPCTKTGHAVRYSFWPARTCRISPVTRSSITWDSSWMTSESRSAARETDALASKKSPARMAILLPNTLFSALRPRRISAITNKTISAESLLWNTCNCGMIAVEGYGIRQRLPGKPCSMQHTQIVLSTRELKELQPASLLGSWRTAWRIANERHCAEGRIQVTDLHCL